jgi:hypothetical protein
MSRISGGKVIAGGILAGIVLGAFDFVTNNFLLAGEWQQVAQRHAIDLTLMSGTGALTSMLVVDLLLGLVLVLTYASIRPRFGAGPATGAIASLIVFLPAALMLASFGGWLLPWDLFFRQVVVLFVAMLAAGSAGAWVYAEEGQ